MNTPHTPFTSQPPSQPTSLSTKKSPYEYRTVDIVTAWLCWLAGYLFCTVIPITRFPLGTFLFGVGMFAGALWLLGRHNPAHLLRGVAQAVVSLLLSLSLLLTYNKAIIIFVFFFNCLHWFYMVFCLSGASKERFPDMHLLREVPASLCVIPFKAPGHLFSALFSAHRSANGQTKGTNRVGKTLGFVMLGLIIAIIPTVVVGILLSYDDHFTQLMGRLFDMRILGKIIRNLVFGLLFGAMLFGALLSALVRRRGQASTAAKLPDDVAPPIVTSTHVVPVMVICAALCPVMLLYIVFFISQWEYYISAFTGIRPEVLTFAEYARHGFFELCTVATINALLCFFASLFAKQRTPQPGKPSRDANHPALRVFLALLSLLTLILIATALSKMYLYVKTYGLTQKRVYASWLMLLLAVCFVAVILRQCFHKIHLVSTLLCIFLLFLLAISVIHVDQIIVSYNVDAYIQGNHLTMQGDVLSHAGVSGVLPALDFLARTEGSDDDAVQETRTQVQQYLREMQDELRSMPSYAHNWVTLRAREALAQSHLPVSPSLSSPPTLKAASNP